MPGGRDAGQQVVAVLATPGASIVELATPAEMLTRQGYDVRVCAIEPGRVALAAGFSVDATHGLDELACAGTVIVPGGRDRGPRDPRPAVTRALLTAAARGARILATGSGTFVLAAAGLLAGRRATTRHDLAEDLRRRFPRVIVDTSVPVTFDSTIGTCAGGTSTLDLCQELVRRDQGRATGDDLGELLEWATANLGEPLGLADLARVACVSPRTLARRFETTLGTSPMQWLLAQRLSRAKYLLDTTCEPIERIARLTGFGSTSNFRLQFTRTTGASPQAYRRAAREPNHLAAG